MNGWERLKTELAKPDSVNLDGYVGVTRGGAWYGGTAYDGEAMEETAVTVQQGEEGVGTRLTPLEVADVVAGRVADKLVEYHAEQARYRAELEAEERL